MERTEELLTEAMKDQEMVQKTKLLEMIDAGWISEEGPWFVRSGAPPFVGE